MQTDIVLSRGNTFLIIDAKYYTHTLQEHYEMRKIHSNNLYQIFTYVKNKQMELAGGPHEVSGMLLYARTDETLQPDATFQMSGNQIDVRTLDLNQEFRRIAAQLDAIAAEHFEESIALDKSWTTDLVGFSVERELRSFTGLGENAPRI